MAKTAPKPSRAALIHELETLIDVGCRMVDAPIETEAALAEAVIARLEWHHTILMILRQLPKGNVAAFADFTRAAGQPAFVAAPDLAEEAARYRESLGAQLRVLDQALSTLKKNRTKRLDQA